MQAYMKSALPFLGVQGLGRERVFTAVFAAHPLASFDDWRDTVLTLWHEATYREERYAALSLVGHYRVFRRSSDALPLLETLIVEGAWWDYVDWVAKYIRELFRRRPAELAPTLRAWSRDENLWKRRVSIISQLGFKADTDLRLLYDCIEPNLADREFFIRKAIGWALRDYAKHDPDEVARYVAQNEARLSPLSRREATKHIARVVR